MEGIWTAPVTNWVSTDYFNLADYTRICQNLLYVQNLAGTMYAVTELKTMEDKSSQGYAAIPYPSDFNAIEQNLKLLDGETYGTGFDSKEWKGNKAAPTYEDFNRWETLQSKMYQTLTAQRNAQRRLAFTLGGQKGIRC